MLLKDKLLKKMETSEFGLKRTTPLVNAVDIEPWISIKDLLKSRDFISKALSVVLNALFTRNNSKYLMMSKKMLLNLIQTSEWDRSTLNGKEYEEFISKFNAIAECLIRSTPFSKESKQKNYAGLWKITDPEIINLLDLSKDYDSDEEAIQAFLSTRSKNSNVYNEILKSEKDKNYTTPITTPKNKDKTKTTTREEVKKLQMVTTSNNDLISYNNTSTDIKISNLQEDKTIKETELKDQIFTEITLNNGKKYGIDPDTLEVKRLKKYVQPFRSLRFEIDDPEGLGIELIQRLIDENTNLYPIEHGTLRLLNTFIMGYREKAVNSNIHAKIYDILERWIPFGEFKLSKEKLDICRDLVSALNPDDYKVIN